MTVARDWAFCPLALAGVSRSDGGAGTAICAGLGVLGVLAVKWRKTRPRAEERGRYPAINAWTFAEGTTPDEQIAQAAAAGFEGIELTVGEAGPLTLDAPPLEFARVGARAAEAGLKIVGLATGVFWQWNYGSTEPADRQRAKDATLQLLDRAAAAQGGSVLVVPALVGRADSVQPAVAYADALERTYEALVELRRPAEERGVVLAIENVWNRFLLSPVEAAALLDRVNSPCVGFYLDTGNVLLYGYPQDWIATLGKRIARVHAKDYDLRRPGKAGFCALGTGSVDWPAVIAALQACGYDGPLTFEGAGAPGEVGRRLREILAMSPSGAEARHPVAASAAGGESERSAMARGQTTTSEVPAGGTAVRFDGAQLRAGITVADGAWSTQLQQLGLPRDVMPEAANLSHAHLVVRLAREYLDAGAKIITTNTFGANDWNLKRRGVGAAMEDVNRRGAELACEAANGRAVLVAGSLGPSGKLMLTQEVSAEQLTALFAGQALALARGGVHVILLETFTEIAEVLLALRAVKDATGLPVIASLSFDSGPQRTRTLMGAPAEEAAAALEDAGADAVGCNCGGGIATALPAVVALRAATSLPLWVKPNAGLPDLEEGRPVYRQSAEEFASFVPTLLEAGANIMGGCCGTGPEHIRRIARLVERRGK